MGIWEYVLGAFLLTTSVALVIIILFQKERASSSRNALEATSNDSYYGKNKGRTKEAFMGKLTRGLAVAMFLVAILLNLFILAPKYTGGSETSSQTSSAVSSGENSEASESSDTSEAASVEDSETSSVEASE